MKDTYTEVLEMLLFFAGGLPDAQPEKWQPLFAALEYKYAANSFGDMIDIINDFLESEDINECTK